VIRAAALFAGLAASAAAQSFIAPGEDGGDREERPGIEFKAAPFTTERSRRPELIIGVETELRAGARLRKLDKMTGASETVELASGDEGAFGRLRIRVAACRAPAGDRAEGTRAHLTVWDLKTPGEPVFAGWMFAESPALSALDHPRFDVWLISCTTSSGVAGSGSE